MKKIINRPQDFVKESIQAIEMAYGGKLRVAGADRRIILRKVPKEKGKVAVVTAGGSGHLPVFLGYVGEGMLDGCAVGNVFASPPAETMEQMIRETDRGAGVLCLYGNYGGDKINFQMAQEMAGFDGIRTRELLVSDDAASAPPEELKRRRGVAGMVYAFKTAGAAAELGWDLDHVYKITERALENIRTMGIALSPCVVPEVGKSTFSIGEGEMEVGMGIHGEPGIEVCPLMTADEIGNLIMNRLLKELVLVPGDEVSVMVNGLGATPMEELLLVYRAVHKILVQRQVRLFMPHLGEFATSMEMSGCSVTVFRLDEELKMLLRLPGSTPFYTSENK